jgi:hypothetical protein
MRSKGPASPQSDKVTWWSDHFFAKNTLSPAIVSEIFFYAFAPLEVVQSKSLELPAFQPHGLKRQNNSLN